jgi:ubiquinone biosynthesis protein UbiJ
MDENAHGQGDPRGGPLRAIAQRLAGGGASAFLGAFNHLLRQNDWARARLAPFAGQRVSVRLEAPSLARFAPPRLAARLGADGLLDASAGSGASSEDGGASGAAAASAPGEAPAGETPHFDAEIHVRPSFPAAGARLGERTRGLAPYLRIEGEPALAAALAEVAERMRWDPEEDLSRITGDVVAHRIGRGVGAARDAMRGLRARVAGSAARRFAAASGTLVARDELESLRARLDALEARISAAEAKRRGP